MSSAEPGGISSSIQTERLLLRCPCVEDVPQVNSAIRESLESLRPWMEWAQSPPSLESTRKRIDEAINTYPEKSDIVLLAFLRESGEFVVRLGLHRINADVPSYAIG